MTLQTSLRRLAILAIAVAAATLLPACSTTPKSPLAQHKPGTTLERAGDEIMVAGQLFHTGTRVVLWTDERGYDAYRTEKRFGPIEQSSWSATTRPTDGSKPRPEFVNGTPNRYSARNANLTPEQQEQIRGGGWTLPMLQDKVDQFVLHYDVAGVSKNCFKVLHDVRNLSVHFLLDVDGTLYQTLDLKERARHATKANDRSIGIEIANMGSYGANESSTAALSQWYKKDENGLVMLTFPKWVGDPMFLTPNFVGRPARNEMVAGEIRGRTQRQYDYTPEQYAALTKLTAALCTVFPKIHCDYPKNPDGSLNTNTLTDEEWAKYQGVLGHYHVQTNKSDPGPAFQWDTVINGARQLMGRQTFAANTPR
jgi:N-acetyl-anhydromuramyl-L-alanine amidase AmpD